MTTNSRSFLRPSNSVKETVKSTGAFLGLDDFLMMDYENVQYFDEGSATSEQPLFPFSPDIHNSKLLSYGSAEVVTPWKPLET